jgi:DNA polymerase II
MYPSIMVKYNISPEAVGSKETDAWEIPGLGIKVSRQLGLVPEALTPVLTKRIALKKMLKDPKLDERLRKRYKALAKALKWLLVVAYGRLGYANSTFGRINSHEAVTQIGRIVLLKAKKIAEDQGFTVLHMYVDSLFLTKSGAVTSTDYQSLMDDIEVETRLPIDLDAIYPWMAFLPSRMKPDVPVANRFFGVLPGGEHKIRGLALRRHDTPPFVSEAQMQALEILATEPNPGRLAALLPEILEMLKDRLALLKKNLVPLEQLVVTQSLSRELEDYRVDTPLSRAARQLQGAGKTLRMGQRVRYIHITGKEEVLAWDLPLGRYKFTLNVARYQELVSRAAFEVLQPLGVSQAVLDGWLSNRAGYILPEDLMSDRTFSSRRLPLFSNDEIYPEKR